LVDADEEEEELGQHEVWCGQHEALAWGPCLGLASSGFSLVSRTWLVVWFRHAGPPLGPFVEEVLHVEDFVLDRALGEGIRPGPRDDHDVRVERKGGEVFSEDLA